MAKLIHLMLYLSCCLSSIAVAERLDTFLNRTIVVCPEASCHGDCYRTRPADATCQCDELCELYGDCCYDFWPVCKNETYEISRRNEILRDVFTCRSISGEHCEVSVRMVDKCPQSTDDKRLVQRCSMSSLGATAPVYGKRGYVYANKFCAHCHGETFGDLTKFTSLLECPEDATISGLLQNLTMGDMMTWFKIQSKCIYNISVPARLKGRVRYCSLKKDYENRCVYDPKLFNTRADYDAVYEACGNYQGFLRSQYDPTVGKYIRLWQEYRNDHCALCSGVDPLLVNVTCPNPQRRFKRQQCFIGPGSIVGPSFTVLLDFNNDFNSDIVLSTRSCPSGETFDALSGECNSMHCLQGYDLVDGKCLLDEAVNYTVLMTASVRFDTVVEHSRRVSKDHIRLILKERGFHANISHECNSPEGKCNIQVDYNKNSANSVFETARRGLDFCSILANESKKVSANFTLQCNVSSKVEDADELCPKQIVHSSELFAHLVGEQQEYNSVLPQLEQQDVLLELSTSFIDTFDGRNGSTLIGEWLRSACRRPRLMCPLILVNDTNIDAYNITHLVLQSGKIYEESDFQIMADQIFICTDYVPVFPEMPVFTLRLGTDRIHYYMTIVGLSLSIAGLALTLLVYMALEQLRTVPGKILMNLAFSLLLAQFFFIFGIEKTCWPKFCVANAFIEHYFWLVSFLWMNVISLDLAKTFVTSSLLSHEDRGRSRLLVGYSVYSWGLPLLHVTCCFLLDIFDVVPDRQLEYASRQACFLSGKEAMLYAFVLPLAVIMAVNILCFLGVLIMLARASSLEKKIQKNRMKRNQLFLFAKLIPITGLTWTFGVVAAFSRVSFLWNPFIIFNALQGVFVFCAFIFNNRVKDMLKARLSRMSHDTTGTSNTRF